MQKDTERKGFECAMDQDAIVSSSKNRTDIVWLLDEITCLFYPYCKLFEFSVKIKISNYLEELNTIL